MAIIYHNPLPIRKQGELANQQQLLTRNPTQTSNTHHAKQTHKKETRQIFQKFLPNELPMQPLLPIILSSCHALDNLLLPPTTAYTLHALEPMTYLVSPLCISAIHTALHDLKSHVLHLPREELLQMLEGFLPVVDRLEEVRVIITEEMKRCGRDGEKEEQRDWLQRMWEVVNDRCVVLYKGFEELEGTVQG